MRSKCFVTRSWALTGSTGHSPPHRLGRYCRRGRLSTLTSLCVGLALQTWPRLLQLWVLVLVVLVVRVVLVLMLMVLVLMLVAVLAVVVVVVTVVLVAVVVRSACCTWCLLLSCCSLLLSL